MTIVTTYTCDKCGHAQDDIEKPKQLWEIGILVREKKSKNVFQYSQAPKSTNLWCRSCVQKLGLLPQEKTTPPTPTPTPTFEDMIREIIQEEIEAGQ